MVNLEQSCTAFKIQPLKIWNPCKVRGSDKVTRVTEIHGFQLLQRLQETINKLPKTSFSDKYAVYTECNSEMIPLCPSKDI